MWLRHKPYRIVRMVPLLSKKGSISELNNLIEIICHPSSTEFIKKSIKQKRSDTKRYQTKYNIKESPVKELN